MKTKLVLWGKDDQEAKVLMAIQLRAEDNQVDVWTFHGENASGDVYKQLMYEWREGKEMAFPESGYNHHESELSATGKLLPENVFPEKDELIGRAKTEWHFVVLSSKLNQVYQIELAELKEEVETLENYSSDKWDKLKLFWDKVREQMQDNNLARDHANSLKRQVNGLFSYLKDLRSAKEAEFQANSATTYEKFNKAIEDVNVRIKKGEMLHLVFEELKSIQRDFRGTQLTREDRAKLWPRIDGAFKAVKEIRFGPATNEGGTGNSPLDRHQHRLTGLIEAITKMERSIRRDKEDLAAQERKKGSSRIGQLESQLLDAKINIIEGRCKSKEEKLANMYKTREEVEKKLAQTKRRIEEKIAKEKAAKEKAAAAPTPEIAKEKAIDAVEEVKEKAAEVKTEVAEAVEEKTAAAKAEVEDVVEATKEKTAEVKTEAVEAVEEKTAAAKAEVKDAVEATKEKAVEVKTEAVEAAEEKTAAVKAEVEDVVEATKEKAVEVKTEAVEAAEEKTAAVKAEVKDVVEATKEKAVEVKTEVVEAAEEKTAAVKAEVKDVVEATKEKAVEVKTEVVEAVEEKTAAAKAKVEDVVETAKEKAVEVKTEVVEAVEEKTAAVKAKIEDVVEATKEKAAEVKTEVAEAAEEKTEEIAVVAEENVEYEIAGEETLPDGLVEDIEAKDVKEE